MQCRCFGYDHGAMVDLIFGNGYEAILAAIALVAAVPYGIYVGLRKLSRRIGGGKRDGDTRTGR